MQDAEEQGFDETAPTLEYSSPASGGGKKGAASCPNRLQRMRRAHADHDIA